MVKVLLKANLWLSACLSLSNGAAQAEPPEFLAGFLQDNCICCHGPEKQKAKLRLDTLGTDFSEGRNSSVWIEVRDQLNLGEMPPADEPQPDTGQLHAVSKWIADELRDLHAQANSTKGRVTLRRLSRTEYANTVRDLLKVTFAEGNSPLEFLPPDGSLEGFDKLSKALLVDPSLMEKYYEVAQLVANRAIRIRKERVPSHIQRFEFESLPKFGNISYQAWSRDLDLVDNGVILMGNAAGTGGPFHPYNDRRIPVAGKYKVRVRAGASQGDLGQPVYMDVNYRAGVSKRFIVDAPLDKPQAYEWEVGIVPTAHANFQVWPAFQSPFRKHNWDSLALIGDANKAFDSGKKKESLRIWAQAIAEGIADSETVSAPADRGFDKPKVPRIFLDYLEVEGPLQEEFPPPSTQYLLPGGYSFKTEAEARIQAHELFTKLLPRAFRRLLVEGELEEHLAIVDEELERGTPYPEALKVGLVSILCSPDFLFLFEPSADGSSRPLSQYELATRLAYFLWSSTPDDELLGLAWEGKLSQPAVLAAQVDRMLADPKAEALVDDFATQWLKIEEFDRFKPDNQIYRDTYYHGPFAGIAKDMEEEPRAMFREILRKDRSVLNLLDSDWIMANGRLAAYYGIPDVKGEGFRPVPLPESSPRGGIVGMAGFHKWGADGNRTKPVERGKYILSVLFNDPPDPPPPNAGEVEPNIQGKNFTVRERLLLHQEVEACAGCHRTIDPYGLAMENFNAVGLWRDKQDGEKPVEQYWGGRKPIVNEGTLPNGQPYSNYKEFKALLAAQSQRFERGLAERLLVYALGRTLEPTDDTTVQGLVSKMGTSGHTLRSLIQAIVQTKAFGTK